MDIRNNNHHNIYVFKKGCLNNLKTNSNVLNVRPVKNINIHAPCIKSSLHTTNPGNYLRQVSLEELALIIPDVIWLYSFVEQRFVYISPSISNLRGLSVKEAMQESMQETLHEDDFDFVMNNLSSRIQHYEQGDEKLQTLTNELRQTHKNGGFIWVEMSTSFVKGHNGKVIGILGVSRNISQRKKEQELLKNTQSFFENVFDFTGTGIVLMHENGSIVNANSGFCKLVSYPKHYVLQKSFFDFLVDGDESCIKELFDAARLEKTLEKQSEIRLINLHGQIIWGLLTISGVKPNEVESNNLLWVIQIQETTGRKKAEEIIRLLNIDLQQKNREMEQLIYVTSHDLRSPLVNIKGFSKELESSFNELKSSFLSNVKGKNKQKHLDLLESEISESFGYINLSIHKMDSLLSGLLKYSRLGNKMSHPTLINMNDLVKEVINTQEYIIKNQNLSVDISDLPPCFASSEMINQAFSNLLENAIKYQDSSRKGFIKISGWIENAFSVYSVEDNGIGIMLQHQEKVFELFYRLNSQIGEGEGLGLSTVKKILDLNAGRIKLESRFGKGSKFIIYLPTKKAEKTP
jgi:PAS domain S-box-containing protein